MPEFRATLDDNGSVLMGDYDFMVRLIGVGSGLEVDINHALDEARLTRKPVHIIGNPGDGELVFAWTIKAIR